MRAGTWSGADSTDNARVTINGTVVPKEWLRKVTIQSGMRDGHPAADTGASWCIEATIEWADRADVTVTAPEPFSGTSWLPKPGDTVVIESGDGALGQWWTQHRGVIDDTRGSLADGTATSTTVDDVEELDSRVHFGALLSRMTPLQDSAVSYREMGMASSWLIDRMLRQAQNDSGWYATPPKTWQTLGSAPNQGSLWPEVGTLLTCSKVGDIYSGPSWIKTPYGVSPIDYVATYSLTGSTTEVILSCAMLGGYGGTSPSTTGTIAAVDTDGMGCFIGLDTATDEITYGITTTGTVTYRLPRGAARRASIYFKRNTTSSQTLTLRTDDGREVTRDPAATGYPTGWAADRVWVTSRAVLGWWLLEGAKPAEQRWATLNSVPTARLRVGDVQWWVSSRDLPWEQPASWLAEQVDAECAAAWLDEDSNIQWAGRGVLDAQGYAQTVTTDLDVDDVQWEARRRSTARSVWVNYLEPSVRRLLGGPRQDAWSEDSIDLGPGEQEVVTIAVPDDEDWISIDMEPALMSGATTPAQLRIGTKYGGTRYDDVDNEPGQAFESFLDSTLQRTGLRSLRWTIATWASVPSYQRFKSAIPDLSQVGSKLARWHSGRPAMRLRAKAITSWTEGERSISAGTLGPSRYTHDVSWRVQSAAGDCIGDLLSWLKTVVSSTNPTVTGLVLSHDPRRQIGDKVRVQDRHVTGLWIDVLVQQRDADLDEMTDSITGRVTAWGSVPGLSLPTPAGPTALTPPTDWNRKVT